MLASALQDYACVVAWQQERRESERFRRVCACASHTAQMNVFYDKGACHEDRTLNAIGSGSRLTIKYNSKYNIFEMYASDITLRSTVVQWVDEPTARRL